LKFPGIRGVIFDFDGTLAPNLDLPLMRAQLVALTEQAGVPSAVFADRYIIEIIEASTAWLHQHDRAAAADYHQRAHNLITRFELDAASRIEPFPEVRDLLARLRSMQVRTAVVTRNCEQAVRNTFPDIDQHLDLLLARDNVSHYKPDPRHLQQALTGLGTVAADSMMIGDGRMDMELGNTLGLTCIGVLTGSSSAAALEASGATLVLDHVRELASLFADYQR
jgi:phosphoglycolate phosphatase